MTVDDKVLLDGNEIDDDTMLYVANQKRTGAGLPPFYYVADARNVIDIPRPREPNPSYRRQYE